MNRFSTQTELESGFLVTRPLDKSLGYTKTEFFSLPSIAPDTGTYGCLF